MPFVVSLQAWGTASGADISIVAFAVGCYTAESISVQLYHDSLVLLYVARVENEEKNGTVNLPTIYFIAGYAKQFQLIFGFASDTAKGQQTIFLSHGCREAVGRSPLSPAGLAASSALEVAGKGLSELQRTWVGPQSVVEDQARQGQRGCIEKQNTLYIVSRTLQRV